VLLIARTAPEALPLRMWLQRMLPREDSSQSSGYCGEMNPD
jgi:hypothetical protein